MQYDELTSKLVRSKIILAVVGPTATGKTDISVALAKALSGQVVSADSVQVYEKLDIGSAKPTLEEMQGITHHLIDVIALQRKHFSVVEYQQLAFDCIESIIHQGDVPILAGGTGFYVQAVTQAEAFTPAGADAEFRYQWSRQEREEPGAAHRELQFVDPQSAAELHPNDITRVIRALEIVHITGKTRGEFKREHEYDQPRYPSIMIGLTMPRELLYQRIEQRVDQMMERGLVQEVQNIMAMDVDITSPSLQGLGYKEIIASLQGKITMEEAVTQIKQGTRNFAKRQWTWFRRDKSITWFDVTLYEDQSTLVNALLRHIEDKI